VVEVNGNRGRATEGIEQVAVSVIGQAAKEGPSSAIRVGKNVRKARCTSCRAPVGLAGLDSAGLCDCCAVQRGLFAVKPWRSRKKSTTGGGRRGRR
jgi:hypothetical protein